MTIGSICLSHASTEKEHLFALSRTRKGRTLQGLEGDGTSFGAWHFTVASASKMGAKHSTRSLFSLRENCQAIEQAGRYDRNFSHIYAEILYSSDGTVNIVKGIRWPVERLPVKGSRELLLCDVYKEQVADTSVDAEFHPNLQHGTGNLKDGRG